MTRKREKKEGMKKLVVVGEEASVIKQVEGYKCIYMTGPIML